MTRGVTSAVEHIFRPNPNGFLARFSRGRNNTWFGLGLGLYAYPRGNSGFCWSCIVRGPGECTEDHKRNIKHNFELEHLEASR